MKKSVQAGKYIVSDFIASSVVWLLFNLIRYEEVAVHEGFDTVGAFLLHIPVEGAAIDSRFLVRIILVFRLL